MLGRLLRFPMVAVRFLFVWLEDRARSPWYGAVITAMTVVLGTLVSYWARPNTSGLIPFGWPLWPLAINWPAFLSWLFLVLWLVLFYTRQAAESKSVQGLRKSALDLKQAVDEVRVGVFTLPPESFLGGFSRQIANIHTKLLSGAPRQTVLNNEKLADVICTLLIMVAGLAQGYDDDRPAQYAANVMVFVPARMSDPYFDERRFHKLDIRRFLTKEYCLDFLEGILFLPEGLSVVVRPGIQGETLGKGREPLIFGIPKLYREEKRDGRKWAVLPGAPLAFAKWNDTVRKSDAPELRDAVQGMDDIEKFGEHVAKGIGQDKFCIHSEVVDAINEYHKSERGQTVRSFQAFPLVRVDGTRTAFGVLNIDCDQPVFLGETSSVIDSRKRQQTFAAVITPIVFEIANAVSLWWELVKKDYGA